MSKGHQENIRDVIKSFDDIFKTVFIIISIALSLGVRNVNFLFIFYPLFLWIFGHALGQKYLDLEIQAKLFAWFHVSFITVAVFTKLLISSDLFLILKVILEAVWLFCSIISTFFVFSWFFSDMLDEELKYRLERELWQWIKAIIPLIVYAKNI